MTQTRAYVPKSTWSNRWSRKRARICVVDVEIIVVAVCHQPSAIGKLSRGLTADSRWLMALSPRVQDLIDPRLEVDDMRPRRPITGARQRAAQRGLQIDQLQPRLRARIGGPRGWRGEARNR